VQALTPGTRVVPPPHWSYFCYGPGVLWLAGAERAGAVAVESAGFAMWIDGGSSSSFASAQHQDWAAPLWLMIMLFAAGPVLWGLRMDFRWRRRDSPHVDRDGSGEGDHPMKRQLFTVLVAGAAVIQQTTVAES
jgi:hypothetical protein